VPPGLKLAPVGPVRVANDVVIVAMVFPLNDLFEFEEFDYLPPIIRPLAKVLSRSLYSNIFEDYQLLINN
jgi:hypothetical protein